MATNIAVTVKEQWPTITGEYDFKNLCLLTLLSVTVKTYGLP